MNETTPTGLSSLDDNSSQRRDNTGETSGTDIREALQASQEELRAELAALETTAGKISGATHDQVETQALALEAALRDVEQQIAAAAEPHASEKSQKPRGNRRRTRAQMRQKQPAEPPSTAVDDDLDTTAVPPEPPPETTATMEILDPEESIPEHAVTVEAADPEEPTLETAATTEWQAFVEHKQTFKQAAARYYDALTAAQSEKHVAARVLGLGRNQLTPEVQAAYDDFMNANKAFHTFAMNSGQYQKIAERYNRRFNHDTE